METTAKQLETLRTAAGCLRAKQAGSGYQDTKLQRQLKATSTECAFFVQLDYCRTEVAHLDVIGKPEHRIQDPPDGRNALVVCNAIHLNLN